MKNKRENKLKSVLKKKGGEHLEYQGNEQELHYEEQNLEQEHEQDQEI